MKLLINRAYLTAFSLQYIRIQAIYRLPSYADAVMREHNFTLVAMNSRELQEITPQLRKWQVFITVDFKRRVGNIDQGQRLLRL